MTTDLHSAVRTAVDEARRLATEATMSTWVWVPMPTIVIPSANIRDEDAAFIAAWSPRRALAMCDWADDVLARHRRMPFDDVNMCMAGGCGVLWPCAEISAAAAAFGVETGETP